MVRKNSKKFPTLNIFNDYLLVALFVKRVCTPNFSTLVLNNVSFDSM